MATYSTKTDKALTPNTVHTATLVDRASIREMTTGANSLQRRSIRLIDAFKSGSRKQISPPCSMILGIQKYGLRFTLSWKGKALWDDNGLLEWLTPFPDDDYRQQEGMDQYPISLNSHCICSSGQFLDASQQGCHKEQNGSNKARPLDLWCQEGDKTCTRHCNGDPLPN